MKVKMYAGILLLLPFIFSGCMGLNPVGSSGGGTSDTTPSPHASLAEPPVPRALGTPLEGQYIVVFKTKEVPLRTLKTLVKQKARGVLLKHGISDLGIDNVYANALTGFSAKISRADVEKLRGDPRIAYVEQDRIISITAKGSGNKPGPAPEPPQETPWGITRVGGPGDGSGKTAWVIDSGVDLDHPDLKVDVARSVSFVPREPSPDDKNGHGTHVAGTIAALNNAIGVVGVAAGATVASVRVLDRRGSGAYSAVIAGVDYVAANGSPGDVANMSLGGPASQALDDAVVAAAQTGVRFALASGNEAANANSYSPARANGPNIFTVSACDNSDQWAYFSNFGNPPIEFCAPGVSVRSSKMGGGTATFSGTSMAAPHVAGLLLLGAINPDGVVTGDPDGNPDPIAHR